MNIISYVSWYIYYIHFLFSQINFILEWIYFIFFDENCFVMALQNLLLMIFVYFCCVFFVSISRFKNQIDVYKINAKACSASIFSDKNNLRNINSISLLDYKKKKRNESNKN